MKICALEEFCDFLRAAQDGASASELREAIGDRITNKEAFEKLKRSE